MKILFMGTPDFAAESLKRLLSIGADICGVFTQPDKPKGRKFTLTPPPVKEVAIEAGLAVYQPATLKNEETAQQIQKLSPDLIVVVAYGKILPKEILDIPPLGCINIHASLLPKYRGAGPIQWSIIKGEKETGVTVMYMSEGLDTGDMILKKSISIGSEETYGELHDRLAQLGADALVEVLPLLEKGKAPRTPQPEQGSSYAPMLDKEIAKIDFRGEAEAIHDLIRGLNPWPVAFALVEGKRLKVYQSRVIAEKSGTPGQVIDSKRLIVACAHGSIELTEVQLEGKKRVSGEEYLRGYKTTQFDV